MFLFFFLNFHSKMLRSDGAMMERCEPRCLFLQRAVKLLPEPEVDLKSVSVELQLLDEPELCQLVSVSEDPHPHLPSSYLLNASKDRTLFYFC